MSESNDIRTNWRATNPVIRSIAIIQIIVFVTGYNYGTDFLKVGCIIIFGISLSFVNPTTENRAKNVGPNTDISPVFVVC